MKKLILLIALFTGGMLCNTTFAQVRLSVNISSQPIWGPVGYDHVENYYLPDIQAYYNVPNHQYTYMNNGHWITRSSLPPRYKGYNLYKGRKVVMNESKPYLRHSVNVAKYAKSNEHSNQQSIRDSHDSKYFVNKDHPEHSKWKGDTKNRGQNKDQEKNRRNN
jgi:hypothetical protein